MENGYSPKDLVFGKDGRDKLVIGIEKISKAVKSTLGLAGNTVLIESPQHTHGITVTKDGVTVAKSIDLLDPVENLAVKIMKEAADKTSSQAGDGTTSSIVLSEALINAGIEYITPEMNTTAVLRELNFLTEKIVDELKSKSRKLSKPMMIDVASISANNDKVIGKIIADAYKKVGKNGIVTVQKSQTINTYSDVTEGMNIDRGYLSPLYVNDLKRDECIMEDVFVLVADIEINNILQIQNVLKPILNKGEKLLIIAPCSSNMVNTLAANVIKNGLKMCAIPPPNFGYKQHELMQDIAVSVGAKYYSEKTGDDLSLISYADLGHVKKIIVGREKTILLKSDLKADSDEINQRVTQLKNGLKEANRKAEKDFIMERIASLVGGIGVIYVGGNTDLEQKELYDRVDDAICAVRSALEEGILAGAGKSLYEINPRNYVNLLVCSQEQMAAVDIISKALKVPLLQILENAGLTYEQCYGDKNDVGYGYNLKTGQYGDLIEMGVIDPLKVTRCALQNAVSVAVTILSTNAIVTMARSYECK